MTPGEAGRRLVIGLAMGLGLGVWYSFLRPLGRRHRALADWLFLLGGFYAWLYHSFAICRSDLRLGTALTLPVGAVVWELTAGRYLQPFFRVFWQISGKIFMIFLGPVIKFFKKAKKCVASVGKWGKIKWNDRRPNRNRPGGTPMEKKNRPKTKFVFHSSSSLLKIVVAVLIVFSVAALLALAWVRSGIYSQIQEMKQEASVLEQENQDLQEKIDELGTPESVLDIAREELGLVDPNTVVIQPESSK